MIQYIKRKDLDVVKYDTCIEKSLQSRIYAFSWYLDIVADNWDALVLDDYDAVMPIPWKKKYFIKYVTQPYFCQQLGIFSSFKIDKNSEYDFLSKVPSIYLKNTLNFNSQNYPNRYTKNRINYILDLKDDYNSIFKKLSKTRRQRVKFGFKNDLTIKHISIDDLLKIQKKFYSYEGFSEAIILELSNYVIKFDKGIILGVYMNNELLGGGLFLKSEKRIIYLYSCFTENGRKHQAASFLIDYVIKNNCESNKILDFEGGNLPNIGAFFKSFGAESETFYQYEKRLFF